MLSYYQKHKKQVKAKAAQYRALHREKINKKQKIRYYLTRGSNAVNGWCGKNPERLVSQVLKENKMDFYVPRSKKEIINWLFWFYDGKYSKSLIAKKEVKKWYFRLRYEGHRKPLNALTEEFVKA